MVYWPLLLRDFRKHWTGKSGLTTHMEDHIQEEQGPLLWVLQTEKEYKYNSKYTTWFKHYLLGHIHKHSEKPN